MEYKSQGNVGNSLHICTKFMKPQAIQYNIIIKSAVDCIACGFCTCVSCYTAPVLTVTLLLCKLLHNLP